MAPVFDSEGFGTWVAVGVGVSDGEEAVWEENIWEENVWIESVPVLDAVDVVAIYKIMISFILLYLREFQSKKIPCPVLTMSSSVSPLRNA
jgi:hypothetical protein